MTDADQVTQHDGPVHTVDGLYKVLLTYDRGQAVYYKDRELAEAIHDANRKAIYFRNLEHDLRAWQKLPWWKRLFTPRP